MNEARRQGEALFPTAGKLAGELFLPTGQTELLETFLHGLAPVFHVVHARHKIEILGDAQILRPGGGIEAGGFNQRLAAQRLQTLPQHLAALAEGGSGHALQVGQPGRGQRLGAGLQPDD